MPQKQHIFITLHKYRTIISNPIFSNPADFMISWVITFPLPNPFQITAACRQAVIAEPKSGSDFEKENLAGKEGTGSMEIEISACSHLRNKNS